MIVKLKWDSELFGRKIGRLTVVPSEEKLKGIVNQAVKEGYRYITCRVVLKRVPDIQLLESQGFYLTDIGVVWEKEIDLHISNPKSQISNSLVREATIKDIPTLKSMVKGLFNDSRFFNDPFFTKKEADKVYQAWIENSLNDKTVKTFLIKDCGFITCKKMSKNKGDISLVGVVSKVQGKGIGSSLILRALDWFNENRMKTVTVRTQLNNVNAMNCYNKMAFKVKYVDITMGLILRGKKAYNKHETGI